MGKEFILFSFFIYEEFLLEWVRYESRFMLYMANELPIEIHRMEDLNSSVKHYLEKKYEKNKLKKALSDNKGFYFQWLCYLLGYPFQDYVSESDARKSCKWSFLTSILKIKEKKIIN